MRAVSHRERELEAACERWLARGRPRPDIALVAGSGLSIALGEPVAGPEPFADWAPFPVRSIAGHDHALELFSPTAGRHVLYFRGRVHAYQGYAAADVAFQVRFAALLGARVLVLTNAAGGVRTDWSAGKLVAIRDHLNLTGLNPLSGEPPASWGPRFPDMAHAYDPALVALARRHAEALGFALDTGVYAGLAGPSYETPAEVRMLRTLGADLAGMSTVLEVIAARHLGLRCLALSLVTNPAAGVDAEPLDHEDVLRAGRTAAARVAALLAALLADPEL
jgi:purine-nucleoside phosphorylase